MSGRRKIPRLLLVGDSLIEYGDWPQLLPGREVLNLGRSGESVEELLERSPNLIRLQSNPDLVLVMIGTNNVAMERFDFLDAYAEILEIFRAAWPESVLLINSLLPMELNYLASATIAKLNDRLRALADQQKARYLDAWRVLVGQNGRVLPGVLEDEVHLTARGYRLWAGTIERVVAELSTA